MERSNPGQTSQVEVPNTTKSTMIQINNSSTAIELTLINSNQSASTEVIDSLALVKSIDDSTSFKSNDNSVPVE